MKDIIRYVFYTGALALVVPLLPVIVLAELVSGGALSKKTLGPTVAN